MQDFILYMPMDNIANGKVIGQGGNGALLEGAVKGAGITPQNDAILGECLHFDGSGAHIDMGNIANVYDKPMTASVWFKAENPASEQILFDKWNMFAARLFRSKMDYAIAPIWDWRTGTEIQTAVWHHLAIVSDKTQKSAYIDGVKVAGLPHSGTPAQENNVLTIGARSRNGNVLLGYQGKMAHLRIYDRALTPDEIGFMRKQDLMQSFRTALPIDFDLYNQDAENVLYIEDEPNQVIRLDIQNKSTQQIRLNALTGDASPTNHHFALRFRPDTLQKPSNIQLAGSGWKMTQITPDTDGMDVIYLLHTTEATLGVDDATAHQTLSFTGLVADNAQGSRGTRVELVCSDQVVYSDNSNLHLGGHSREIHLNVVNHRGKKNIPLHVGFVGDNGVLNDGQTANNLKLRFTNVGKLPLVFKKDNGDDTNTSKFILSFDTRNEAEWALGGTDLKVKVKAPKLHEFDQLNPDWSTPTEQQSINQEIEITPNNTVLLSGKGGSGSNYFEIEISDIITSYPTGHTHLYVRYENIPGYWDGEKTLIIEKRPLVYKHKEDINNKNVGIGTNTPGEKLEVKGNTKLDGNTEVTGNVGIGTNASDEKLEVKGNTKLDGNTEVTGKIGIGIKNPEHQLEVQGRTRITHSGTSGLIIENSPGKDDDDYLSEVSFNGGTARGAVGVSRDRGLYLWENGDRVNIKDGKVGIGTKNPQIQLAIGDSDTGLQQERDGELAIYTNNQERVRVDSIGRVGIGTSDPQYKLEVQGRTRITHSGTSGLIIENSPGKDDDDYLSEVSFNGGTARGAVGVSRDRGLYLWANYQDRVNIKDGNVGIGTNKPQAKLHVEGEGNKTPRGDWDDYLDVNGVTRRGGPQSSSNSLSIYSSGTIAAPTFLTFSDQRIKHKLKASSNEEDLRLLNQLRVTRYQYIDAVGKGPKMNVGFIAQEVEAIFPEAVSKTTDFIPNVYANSTKVAFRGNALQITLDKPHNFVKHDQIRLIGQNGPKEVVVSRIISEVAFEVEGFDKGDLFDQNRVFVFGKKVDDFKTVDYQEISVVAVGAIQELSKENDAQKATIAHQQQTITQLTTQMQQLIERVEQLESNTSNVG